MTRAQSQVIAWSAPSNDEPNGGLSRLLRGRPPGDSEVPDQCVPPRIDYPDATAGARLGDRGGPVLEESVIAPRRGRIAALPTNLDARHFRRHIDASWRRTSYSGLIRAAEDDDPGVSSEPDVVER